MGFAGSGYGGVGYADLIRGFCGGVGYNELITCLGGAGLVTLN